MLSFKQSIGFKEFFESDRSGGVVLIFCTIISLLLANISESYIDVWNTPIGEHTLTHWINDGLMTIFFLLIGLELEREVYIGELSNFKKASLPIVAALGGMIVPAACYFFVNRHSEFSRGIGIPMATDIAFALGVLSLLGKRVPLALKIFLTALAVIDDLGAILLIAIFYTQQISWLYLSLAIGIFVVLLVLNRLKVHRMWPYLSLGVVMWYCMIHSGVHATITGVLLAFAIPFGNGDEGTPSAKLHHLLHKSVAFIILPIFAIANTAIPISSTFYVQLGNTIGVGIMIGLLIGKPLGIIGFTWIAVKTNVGKLSQSLTWKHIIGAGFLGGIGFTMSIFISLLAFSDSVLIDQAKIAVMIFSVIAGLIGFFWLKVNIKQPS
ncbi:Na+/H+ antiporter NhaA [Pseudochryseolinea flava]|uniref:Na(+)/H(+) antiporter NhaA n=1 Tax=Pseudochryseolinea flava TaxID=2059302 RepID=A0A364Y206_9BACT|nr:Na+/H+ antiporter NhaA [Pseudochryseolinea flava]RAW00905.1 Na+/H+ antiporter NhaA [Pseudochryseolinea flava]